MELTARCFLWQRTVLSRHTGRRNNVGAGRTSRHKQRSLYTFSNRRAHHKRDSPNNRHHQKQYKSANPPGKTGGFILAGSADWSRLVQCGWGIFFGFFLFFCLKKLKQMLPYWSELLNRGCLQPMKSFNNSYFYFFFSCFAFYFRKRGGVVVAGLK